MYPNLYPNNKVDTWTIEVPEGRRVRLEWVGMDIEESSGCWFDFVEVARIYFLIFCSDVGTKVARGKQRRRSADGENLWEVTSSSLEGLSCHPLFLNFFRHFRF